MCLHLCVHLFCAASCVINDDDDDDDDDDDNDDKASKYHRSTQPSIPPG